MPDAATSTDYRGRFAPSPTGLLHAGSLLAALASWLDARANSGSWFLRIEDLDPPRESRAAADGIISALDRLGLHWDGSVLYQSSRHEAYAAAIEELREAGRIFACTCSRQDLHATANIYPGTCRGQLQEPDTPYALRCLVDDLLISFEDRLQGNCRGNPACEVGDFIVRRKDGLFAYQLAVVVDDAMQGITDVVRGVDLLDSTPRQILLQQLLHLPQPRYAHIPVIVDSSGNKLGKQQGAAPINPSHPVPALFQALTYLGQKPARDLLRATPQTLLEWAVESWRPETLRGQQKLTEIPSQEQAGV